MDALDRSDIESHIGALWVRTLAKDDKLGTVNQAAPSSCLESLSGKLVPFWVVLL